MPSVADCTLSNYFSQHAQERVSFPFCVCTYKREYFRSPPSLTLRGVSSQITGKWMYWSYLPAVMIMFCRFLYVLLLLRLLLLIYIFFIPSVLFHCRELTHNHMGEMGSYINWTNKQIHRLQNEIELNMVSGTILLQISHFVFFSFRLRFPRCLSFLFFFFFFLLVYGIFLGFGHCQAFVRSNIAWEPEQLLIAKHVLRAAD